MSREFHIYGLVDPRDGVVRYVGKTRAGVNRRLCNHVSDARTYRKNLPVARWIRSIMREGVRPQAIVLVEGLGDDHTCDAAERAEIAARRAAGELLNCTDGGDGAPGICHSAESRAKISRSKTGTKLSDEHRARISAALAGRPSGRLGEKASDETRAKLSAAKKGVPKSDAHKKSIGDANRGKRRDGSRLTVAQADEIRASYKGEFGEITRIARAYDVAPTRIRKVVGGWRKSA